MLNLASYGIHKGLTKILRKRVLLIPIQFSRASNVFNLILILDHKPLAIFFIYLMSGLVLIYIFLLIMKIFYVRVRRKNKIYEKEIIMW